MSVLTKAARLFSRHKKPELARNTVKHDRIDSGVLKEWIERAPRLKAEFDNEPAINHEMFEELDSDVWRDLVSDAFYEHFGYDEPQVLDESEVLPSRHVNRVLADKLSRSEELRSVRSGTKNRPLESALATISAAQSLRESFEHELKEHGDRASELANLEQSLDALEELLASMRSDNQTTPDAHDAADMKELIEKRQNIVKNLANLTQEQGIQAPQIAGAAQQAVRKAAQASKDAVEQVKSIPGIGIGKAPGAGANLSPDVMFDLAERWAKSGVLKKIAELLGRLLPEMRTDRRTKRRFGVEEIVDIETGNDLPAVLPAELMRLKHPKLKLDFYRRFQEAQLLMYERASTEDFKKGPMIVVIDESLSMGGAKIIWAKATAIALLMIANRENRSCALISFGSPGQLESWLWPKGKPIDPVTLTDAAEHFFNGGTSILTGLTRAAEIVKAEAPFHRADVIVVTDGEDNWTAADAEVRDYLRGESVTIHGVTCGTGPTAYLLELAERTTPVYEFEGGNEATSRLASSIA
jgi:uncharacterized protein with von Willebrand factor type A (vWA) domain